MGYFQNRYDNWLDYAESEGVRRTCDFCGREFTPAGPTQKRHRRNPDLDSESEYMEAAICEDEQWKASLSPRGFVTRVLGMPVAEFIAAHGRAAFESL